MSNKKTNVQYKGEFLIAKLRNLQFLISKEDEFLYAFGIILALGKKVKSIIRYRISSVMRSTTGVRS